MHIPLFVILALVSQVLGRWWPSEIGFTLHKLLHPGEGDEILNECPRYDHYDQPVTEHHSDKPPHSSEHFQCWYGTYRSHGVF